MMMDDMGLAPTVRRYADAFKEQAGLDINDHHGTRTPLEQIWR